MLRGWETPKERSGGWETPKERSGMLCWEGGMGKEKWGYILGEMPDTTRNVALLEMPKYFASRFS